MALDTIIGNLREIYKKTIYGTALYADELTSKRRTNVKLRNHWFYTPDGQLYFSDHKTPKLAITRESENLVLRHIDDAFTQLVHNHNYHPNSDEAMNAIKARQTVVVDLTQLKLIADGDEWCYLPVSTINFDLLNKEERKLAERIYGRRNNFIANMVMFADRGIRTTNIYVLNPNYVQREADKSPIMRSSWLSHFNGSSHFNAGVRDVNNHGQLYGTQRHELRSRQ